MKYRKKPVTIEAMQLTGATPDTMRIHRWMEENGYPTLIGDPTRPDSLQYEWQGNNDPRPSRGIYIDPATGDLVIRTLEGDMHASAGDYIIRGVQGEMYACKPDIFEATYEEAGEPAADTNQQRAVEVLSRHWSVAQETQQDDEAVCCAEALADAGLLMPDGSRLNREGAWTGLNYGHIYIRYAVDDTHLSPAEAREFALDLLAAADHMEKNA